MSKSFINGDRITMHDIPTVMKAAAFDVLAEASVARKDLRGAAAQMATDAREGAASMQVHARRAAAIGGSAAAVAMETGLRAGTRAWHDARRQAAVWGSTALDQARSRPATVLIGVAVIGVAVGFWLRGASRRAVAPGKTVHAPRTAKHNGA